LCSRTAYGGARVENDVRIPAPPAYAVRVPTRQPPLIASAYPYMDADRVEDPAAARLPINRLCASINRLCAPMNGCRCRSRCRRPCSGSAHPLIDYAHPLIDAVAVRDVVIRAQDVVGRHGPIHVGAGIGRRVGLRGGVVRERVLVGVVVCHVSVVPLIEVV
jgi:hypothetical protein